MTEQAMLAGSQFSSWKSALADQQTRVEEQKKTRAREHRDTLVRRAEEASSPQARSLARLRLDAYDRRRADREKKESATLELRNEPAAAAAENPLTGLRAHEAITEIATMGKDGLALSLAAEQQLTKPRATVLAALERRGKVLAAEDLAAHEEDAPNDPSEDPDELGDDDDDDDGDGDE